jgi:hypothetical protein
LLKKAASIIIFIMLLVSMQPLVFAAKFNLGDIVEVFNTGASGLVVRDAPAGNAIGKKYDGDRGVVIAGPQNAYLGGVLYTWWKVRWAGDSLEGWSAENWLMKVTPPDLTVEDIWIYPESFNPGSGVTIYTRIKNIGAGAAASGQGLWIKAYFDGGLCYQEGIEGLGAGYAYTFQWGYTWPSNTNWHTIEVRVDPSNYIIESNEGNNIRSESFQATAPPPPNQPPTLYNGYVTPSSGDTSTTFSYYVTYSDTDGDVPTTKYVYIDGSPYTMTMISGGYVSGAVFRYSTTLSASGSHNYYFYFADSVHSHTVRLPTSGTYSGPTVPPPPEYRTLTVYSSPSGVSFTANGVSHTTPWSGTYSQGTSVNLVMPSVYSGGDVRYYWDKWSDGVTSSSRTIVLNSDTTVTGNYIGPYYELTVDSSAGSPSGIPFTLNGATKTTPFSEWLFQGYYTIEMPATYSGYLWQYWLEDGVTNRIRTISLTSTSVSLTAVYSAPYAPSLSIPVYSPMYQSAYLGTTLAYIVRVENAGGATDTICMDVTDDIGFPKYLSEYLVSLEPHQSRDLYLYVTVGARGTDKITIHGRSQTDPSKTASCSVSANGYSDGYGLFNVELKFSNDGMLSSRLLFSVPSYVKINASELFLPSSTSGGISVVFDPRFWDVQSNPNLNSFSIDVEDRPYGETAVIPVTFEGRVISATDFDLTEDSYSFENGLFPESDTCYGMAATAIFNRGSIPSTYEKTMPEAKSKIMWYQGSDDNYLLGMDLYFGLPPNEENEYEKLKSSLDQNVPIILALHAPGFIHAVVAYKIVEVGQWAYIFCYDSNEPFTSLSSRFSFTYAAYNKLSHELLFCGKERGKLDTCEFKAHEPWAHIMGIPFYLRNGLTELEQILAFRSDLLGTDMAKHFEMLFKCPINITITDQYGRIISDNGTNQIPNARVISANGMTQFNLPLEFNYSVFMYAYDFGSFDLLIMQPLGNYSVLLNSYENVSVTLGTSAILELTPNLVNRIIKIDNDGDGNIDELRSPSASETIYIPMPVVYSFSVVWGEETFIVTVESNSSVSDFAFNQPGKEISFSVNGDAGTIGFCNVTISKALLYGEPWTLLIDGASMLPTITENATHTSLHFTYTHSTHTIQIIGTWVIGPPTDATPPLIQTPFQQPEPDKVTPDKTVTVYVNVTDMESGVKSVILSYTTNGGATWNNLTMLLLAGNEFQAVIPAFPSGTNICYKIIAYDNSDNVAINDNAGQYYCYAVNPPAPPPLSVSISPLSASILAGQSVTFTSTVSGGYTPYSYQWYLNGNPVSGATSASWTFTPTASGIYYVYLKVTDDKGNTAQSDTARITATTVPVGGYSFPIQVPTKAEPIMPYIASIATLTAVFTTIKRKVKRKSSQN